MADLSDNELKAFQDRLNRFEPKDVHVALDGIDRQPLAGTETADETTASGPNDFGSIEAGVLIYRLEPGRVRIRITMAEMTGGSYDDVDVSDANLGKLVVSLVAKLEGEHAPTAS